MTIGQRIAACRKAKRLSQEYVAEVMGVTRQAVSKWETDVNIPDTQNFIKLSRLFGTTVEYLANGEADIDFSSFERAKAQGCEVEPTEKEKTLIEGNQEKSSMKEKTSIEGEEGATIKEKPLFVKLLGLIICGLGFVIFWASVINGVIFIPAAILGIIIILIGGGMAFRRKPLWD